MQDKLPGTVARLTGNLRDARSRGYGSLCLAACLAAVLMLSAPGNAQAQVQWNPFKPGFGKQAEPQAQQERIPVAPPPSSVTSPKAAPAAAPKPQPSSAPVSTSQQPTSPPSVAPLPPPRPANLQSAPPATANPAATAASTLERPGVRAAAIEAAKAATSTGANPAPTSSAEALARVNDWLNSYEAIQARFIQHNAQGQKAEGSLYVRRPGQLVFKYDPPSTLEIVADGKSVAVRDSKLRTNDVYSIGQTPLKFLLKDRVSLATDTKLLNVSTDADGIVRVALSDSSTLGGTSKITLIFDSRANLLKQWNIVDPQGYQTTVALYNLRTTDR